MTISVVIATYNRAGELAECLGQLRRQAFQRGDEVVVADNGSTDGTAPLLARATAAFPVPLRVVREERPGKSHAVAAALAGSRSDLLAFTDDDVLVADDWVATIHRTMERERLDLVGGRVLPRFAARVPDWLALREEGVRAAGFSAGPPRLRGRSRGSRASHRARREPRRATRGLR